MVNVFGTIADALFGMPEARVEGAAPVSIATPMDDGVLLAGDRYPPDGDAPRAVALIRTPYNKKSILTRLYAELLSRRGIQVVIQDVRGTFASPGEFTPFHRERSDGLATVAWLRDQPWCDGRVAMAGMNYLGHTQWAIAPYLDQPLEAMAIGISGSTFTPTFYPGGEIALFTLLSWVNTIGTQEEPLAWLRTALGSRRLEQAMATLPLVQADRRAIDKTVSFHQEVVAHAQPGDNFWSDVEHDRALADVRVPTSMVAGWYDIFLQQQLQDFTALQQAGVSSRLTVGPWSHGERASIRPMMEDQVTWLEAHLHDDPALIRTAPVRIFLQGAQRWLDFDQWPVAAEETEMLLTGSGRLVNDVPAESGTRQFVYDPADPTPTVGGIVLGMRAKRADNTSVEQRDDVLVYSGAVLAEDLDLIGELQAEIFVQADRPHFDLFVRLCDVDRRGRSWNVCDGIVRVDTEALTADDHGVHRVVVDLFPTAYRFRAGHRLRVQVTAGAFPNYARNMGTGESAVTATETRPVAITVHHGEDHPTRLRVPRFTGAR